MNCQRCNYSNDESREFCVKCGWELAFKYTLSYSQYNKDLIIMSSLIFLFSTNIFWSIFPRIVHEWWKLKYMIVPLNLLIEAVPLFLSFSISIKSLKRTSITIGIINVIIAIIKQITFLSGG